MWPEKRHPGPNGKYNICKAQKICPITGPNGEPVSHIFLDDSDMRQYEELALTKEYDTLSPSQEKHFNDLKDKSLVNHQTLMLHKAKKDFGDVAKKIKEDYSSPESRKQLLQDALDIADHRTKTVPWGRFDSFVANFSEFSPESKEQMEGRLIANHVRHNLLEKYADEMGKPGYDKYIETFESEGWEDGKGIGVFKKLWGTASDSIEEEFPETVLARERGEEIKKLYGPYRATGELNEEAKSLGMSLARISQLKEEQNNAVTTLAQLM